MAERSKLRRLKESRPLQDKSDPRNKKREKLMGKKGVAQQNMAATAAKTDAGFANAASRRVSQYKKAAKKKPQFASVGGAKKFNP